MIQIRVATPDDTVAVLDLAERFLSLTPFGKLIPVNRDRLETLLAGVFAQGAVYLAEFSEADYPHAVTVVGFIAIVLLEHPMSAVPYVEELAWWVEPVYRSGTLGPRLLAQAENWAVANGARMIKMGAPQDAPEVGRFYERLGYAPIETAYAKVLHDIHDDGADRVGRGRRTGGGLDDERR